jgi:glutaredoxin 2
MFGMSSIDFWENDPQLYWAYRFSYIKKLENDAKIEKEKMQLNCWLQGKINEIAFEVALQNAFSKKKAKFPTYEEVFKKSQVKNEKIYNDLKEKLKDVEDENVRQQIEFNYWARL